MVEILATAVVDESKVHLVKDSEHHYLYWGDEDEVREGMSRTQLLTPKGRKPTPNSIYRKFLQAVRALNYVKINKLDNGSRQ